MLYSWLVIYSSYCAEIRRKRRSFCSKFGAEKSFRSIFCKVVNNWPTWSYGILFKGVSTFVELYVLFILHENKKKWEKNNFLPKLGEEKSVRNIFTKVVNNLAHMKLQHFIYGLYVLLLSYMYSSYCTKLKLNIKSFTPKLGAEESIRSIFSKVNNKPTWNYSILFTGYK